MWQVSKIVLDVDILELRKAIKNISWNTSYESLQNFLKERSLTLVDTDIEALLNTPPKLDQLRLEEGSIKYGAYCINTETGEKMTIKADKLSKYDIIDERFLLQSSTDLLNVNDIVYAYSLGDKYKDCIVDTNVSLKAKNNQDTIKTIKLSAKVSMPEFIPTKFAEFNEFAKVILSKANKVVIKSLSDSSNDITEISKEVSHKLCKAIVEMEEK